MLEHQEITTLKYKQKPKTKQTTYNYGKSSKTNPPPNGSSGETALHKRNRTENKRVSRGEDRVYCLKISRVHLMPEDSRICGDKDNT